MELYIDNNLDQKYDAIIDDYVYKGLLKIVTNIEHDISVNLVDPKYIITTHDGIDVPMENRASCSIQHKDGNFEIFINNSKLDLIKEVLANELGGLAANHKIKSWNPDYLDGNQLAIIFSCLRSYLSAKITRNVSIQDTIVFVNEITFKDCPFERIMNGIDTEPLKSIILNMLCVMPALQLRIENHFYSNLILFEKLCESQNIVDNVLVRIQYESTTDLSKEDVLTMIDKCNEICTLIEEFKGGVRLENV